MATALNTDKIDRQIRHFMNYIRTTLKTFSKNEYSKILTDYVEVKLINRQKVVEITGGPTSTQRFQNTPQLFLSEKLRDWAEKSFPETRVMKDEIKYRNTIYSPYCVLFNMIAHIYYECEEYRYASYFWFLAYELVLKYYEEYGFDSISFFKSLKHHVIVCRIRTNNQQCINSKSPYSSQTNEGHYIDIDSTFKLGENKKFYVMDDFVRAEERWYQYTSKPYSASVQNVQFLIETIQFLKRIQIQPYLFPLAPTPKNLFLSPCQRKQSFKVATQSAATAPPVREERHHENVNPNNLFPFQQTLELRQQLLTEAITELNRIESDLKSPLSLYDVSDYIFDPMLEEKQEEDEEENPENESMEITISEEKQKEEIDTRNESVEITIPEEIQDESVVVSENAMQQEIKVSIHSIDLNPPTPSVPFISQGLEQMWNAFNNLTKNVSSEMAQINETRAELAIEKQRLVQLRQSLDNEKQELEIKWKETQTELEIDTQRERKEIENEKQQCRNARDELKKERTILLEHIDLMIQQLNYTRIACAI